MTCLCSYFYVHVTNSSKSNRDCMRKPVQLSSAQPRRPFGSPLKYTRVQTAENGERRVVQRLKDVDPSTTGSSPLIPALPIYDLIIIPSPLSSRVPHISLCLSRSLPTRKTTVTQKSSQPAIQRSPKGLPVDSFFMIIHPFNKTTQHLCSRELGPLFSCVTRAKQQLSILNTLYTLCTAVICLYSLHVRVIIPSSDLRSPLIKQPDRTRYQMDRIEIVAQKRKPTRFSIYLTINCETRRLSRTSTSTLQQQPTVIH